MKRILFVALISISSAFAHELDFNTYLKMQSSLASDDFKTALSSHKTICDKELIHYKDDYKDCDKKFKDIDDLRNSFKQLSVVYFENGNKKELQKLFRFSCPMAKATWVQKEPEMRNPYYGKSMLECGEKL